MFLSLFLLEEAFLLQGFVGRRVQSLARPVFSGICR
jgi:hypothetical protein